MNWLQQLLNRLSGRPATPSRSRPTKSVQQGATSNPARNEQTLRQWLLQSEASPMTSREKQAPQPAAIARLQSRIHQIPPMPETWNAVQQLLAEPHASASDLANVVSRDPVLTARILKTCNSPAFAGAGGNEIGNMPLAVARLGLDETTNIIFQTLAPKLGEQGNRAQARHIWQHSQSISALMRLLAEPTPHISRHDASLVGMLHDIGKLVILQLESPYLLVALQAAIESGRPALECESELLGYTHIDAGMMLALHWRLPRQVHAFIDHHHAPDAGDAAGQLLNLAHIALQQISDRYPATSQPGIWQQSMRSQHPEAQEVLERELGNALDSPALLNQLERQVVRIRSQFPDLYPATETDGD